METAVKNRPVVLWAPLVRSARSVFFATLVLVAALADSLVAADLEAIFFQALENDPRFMGSTYERDAEQELLRQAWAGILPTVSGEGVYTRTRQDVISTDNEVFGAGRSTFPTSEYTLSLRQPLFNYSSFINIRRAQALARGADKQLEAARQELALRVAVSYFRVLSVQDRLEATEAEEAAVSRHYDLVSESFNRGLSTRAEYYDAKARLAEIQANRLAVESDLDDARQALEEITGYSADGLSPLREYFPLILPDPADADAWIEAAINQNPVLEAIREEVEAARQEIRRRKGGHYPAVDLEANHNWRKTDGTLFGGGSEVETSNFLVRMNLPLYQGGIVSSRIREMLHRMNAAMEEEKRLTRSLQREARAAYFGVGNSIERVKALHDAMEAQQLALEGKKDGYRSGLFTILAVLDGERDFSLAKQNYAMARYDYIINSLILKKTAGILEDSDIMAINEWLVALP